MVSETERNDPDRRLLTGIAAALQSGDSARASQLADEALARGVNHPLPYQARALHLDRIGNGSEALANYLRAERLSPNDPLAVNGVALCLARLGRFEQAMTAFEKALALDPNLAITHFHMGSVLEMHEHLAAAGDAYRRAVALSPEHVQAWTGLATAAEGRQDWKEVRIAAGRALSLDARQPRLIASLASAEINEAHFGAAEARLRAALQIPGYVPQSLRAVMLGLLADALDGQNKTEDAFAFYVAENNERGKDYAASSRAIDMAKLVRDLAAYFTRTYPAQWAQSSDSGESGMAAAEHVFLMGFPRSGTTLMEQVLNTHPNVETLEEGDVLDAAAERFLRDARGLDSLASLCGEDLSRARDEYWQRVRALGIQARGMVFVDKLPLNTIKLPLIAKLFPNAKILFALRDPRDVVLSCFRRHFRVNASTYPFLTFDGAAAFYNSVMILGDVCRERLPLRFHIYRHEDLVQDFDAEMRRICEFAGIAWTHGFRDFAHAARLRNIRSISAAQVRRGLYTDGVGQWRRYAAQLEPVLSTLRPWIEKFGYEPV